MVDRFEDLWEFNVTGNYSKELETIIQQIQRSRKEWKDLTSFFKSQGAIFGKSSKGLKESAEAAEGLSKAAKSAAPLQAKLASSARVLAEANNKLVKEQNRLNIARVAETAALRQAQLAADPQIIRARAEVAALKQLTAQLEKETRIRVFRNEAAKAGLKANAEGNKLLNIEADAAKKAAKEQERLALAEALRAKGLDARGRSIPTPLFDANGAATPRAQDEARAKAAKQLDTVRLDNLRKSLLANNKEFAEARKRATELDSQLASLTPTGARTDTVFSKLGSTVKRLFGAFAIFTVARGIVSQFNQLVSSAVKFQAELEATKIGLSGIVAAAADVRSPTGESLGIGDQLLESQRIASDQMQKLRRDALQTSASYDQLARAFQNAIAPGLQSNLSLDQIRQLTVSISQAATGLGLAQDQLAEEIRAIFQGTVSPRNTRIATALGITNQDISRAKEAGNLFSFLEKRFRAISLSGKLLMDTFVGQLSNAADAFKQLTAEASRPLFEQLKGALRDIQKGIFTATEDAVIFRPETLNAFKALFDGIATGVRGIRAAFQSVDLSGLGAVLGTIGQSLGLAGTVLANAFSLALDAVSPVFTVLNKILKVISDTIALVNLSALGYGKVLKAVIGLALKILVAEIAVRRLVILSKLLGTGFDLARNAVVRLATASKIASISVAAIGKGSALIINNFKKIFFFTTLIGGALLLVDKAIKALGVEGGLIENVGGFVGNVVKQIDDALLSISGLKETLSEPVEGSLGIVVGDFKELRSDLAELTREASLRTKRAVLEIGQEFKNLGLPDEIARQFQDATRIRLDFENQDGVLQARSTLAGLQSQLNAIDQTSLSNAQQSFRNLEKEIINQEIALQSLEKKTKDYADQLSRDQKRIATGGFFGISPKLTPEGEKLEVLRATAKRDEAQLLTFVREQERLADSIAKKLAEQSAIKSQIKLLTDEIAKVEKESREEQAASLRRSAQLDSFQTGLRLRELPTQVDTIRAEITILGVRNKLEGEYQRAIANTTAVRVAGVIEQKRQEDAILRLGQEIRNQENQGSDRQTIEALQLQRNLRLSELASLREINQLNAERAAREEEIARLRKEGTATQGIQSGIDGFVAENSSLFNIGESFGRSAAEGIATFGGEAIGTTIAAAVDPNKSKSLSQALGNLATSLGTQLATQIFSLGLASLLQSLVPSLFAAQAGLQSAAATGAGTLASGGVATGAAITTGSGTAAKLLTAAGIATGSSILVAAAQAAFLLATAGGGRNPVGISRAEGGPVPGPRGFATGGRAGRIDPRDTIPAMLRPGEWVIRPEAVDMYGDRLFQMLNGRLLDPSALRAAAGGGRATTKARAVRSFATGGKVASGRAGRSQGESTMVTSLQFFDPQTMDRALAAGDGAAPRFARRKRAAYRVALGLDQG